MRITKLLSVLLLIFLSSCQDDEVNDFYNKPVNLKVDITMQDNDLSAPMSAKSITSPRLDWEFVGYGGLLLYRGSVPVDGFPGIPSLYAFDLACPVEKIFNQKIHYIGDGKAKCDKCETIYDLSLGVGNAIGKPSNPRLVVYPAYYMPGDHVVFHVQKNR